MTFKKPTRAGLLALVFGILLGLCLSVPSYSPTYAQEGPGRGDPPPIRPPARRRPATAPPSRRDLENCTPNSGDTAWMLTSMAIVLMMTIPGLALFYGGMVRKKNVGDTVMTSFAITCLISVLWLLFTYSLAFRVRQCRSSAGSTVPACRAS